MFQRNFKELVAHYKRLRRLPKAARGLAERATDRFLVSGAAPRLLTFLKRRKEDRDKRDQAAAAMDVAC